MFPLQRESYFMKQSKIIIFSLVFLAACTNDPNEIPEGIVARDSMVNVMAEIHIAEARIMKAGNRSEMKDLKSAYMQQVLSNAGIDTARFRKSFDFYSTHPEIFAVMYEEVVVAISKKQAAEMRDDK